VPKNEASYADELHVAVAAARDAGAAIRDFYKRANAATYTKSDGSPVTDADLAADRIIREHVRARFPADAILTEEGADDRARLRVRRCWVVDPLDGTAQFVAHTGEFDVLVALVVAGRPVVGVAYQPIGDLLCAATLGGGAWLEHAGERRSLQFAPVRPGEAPRPATSTWFGGPATLPRLAHISERAAAAPPALVDVGFQARSFLGDDASGRAYDVFMGLPLSPEEAMASEWDFAASDVITTEAGGVFSDLRGQPHRYNKPTPRNFRGLLIASDPITHARFLAALRDDMSTHGEYAPEETDADADRG